MTTHAADDLLTATPLRRWGWATSLTRLFMVPPLVILLRIAASFVLDPSHAAAPTGVSLTTPEALTDTRVVGGLAVAVAAVVAAAIFSRTRLRLGHATIAVMMASILAIRLFGFATDGTTLEMGGQRVKTTGEGVFLVLNAIGYAVHHRGSKRREVRP